MRCPQCGALFLAGDVSLTNLVAKCANCNEVFSFDDQLRIPTQANGAQRFAKLPVPQPDSLQVEDDGLQRRIIRRWFSKGIGFVILFCIAWDSFLVSWYWMAFTRPDAWLLISLIFQLPHVAIGLWTSYFTFASLINKTIVQVDDNLLTVRHGPLPYYANRSLEVSNLVQLYCDENRYRRSVSYNVNALLTDGSKLKLLRGLERDQALFYEDRLEEWLGIEPCPVVGEVKK
jgi:phage FluMu protein Com